MGCYGVRREREHVRRGSVRMALEDEPRDALLRRSQRIPAGQRFLLPRCPTHPAYARALKRALDAFRVAGRSEGIEAIPSAVQRRDARVAPAVSKERQAVVALRIGEQKPARAALE